MGKLDGRAPEITEKINAGKKVWHKYDCIGCHTILGNGSYFAPDMTKVAEHKPKGYLKKFILDPKAIRTDASIPKLGLTEEEAENLMAFLEWVSKVDTNNWPPEPILAVAATAKATTPGQVVYQKHECAECHQVRGIGGTAGPDLTHIGSKIADVEWHIQHLKDPESVIPDSAMPSFDHLTNDELKQISEYLVTLK